MKGVYDKNNQHLASCDLYSKLKLVHTKLKAVRKIENTSYTQRGSFGGK
jgi:hypothetical protein